MSEGQKREAPENGVDFVWHTADEDDVLRRLSSGPEGLTSGEAALRLEHYGPNRLEGAAGNSPLAIFVGQFRDFMIIVLIVAAVISGVLGDIKDAIAIAVILIINAAIGAFQEYRAERAIEALQKMAAVHVVVLRDGKGRSIEAGELVPGDVANLQAGDVVPADMRLLEGHSLSVDEAMLTGESVPAEKRAGCLDGSLADITLADRENMLYSGTRVTRGRAVAVVVQTGPATEMGRIAELIESSGEARTPLQTRLNVFGRYLAIFALGITAFIFVIGLLRGLDPLTMFLTAVTLAVAAIPEALPAVVTISLALGAQRMVKRNALIRSLPAVETLGSVTVICSDKTGTLTENRMRVEEMVSGTVTLAMPAEGGYRTEQGEEPGLEELSGLMPLFTTAVLCNDAELSGEKPSGDPTEIALLEMASVVGIHPAHLRRENERTLELPFDSTRMMMSVVCRKPDGDSLLHLKGAPEKVLPLCTAVSGDDRQEPLDDAARAAWEVKAEELSSRGLRVLAVAQRDVGPEGPLESGLVLAGLIAMADPPRPAAAAAVAECRAAGIRPVMITGDHPATATLIAKRLGIIDDRVSGVMTGAELAALSREELDARIEDIAVFARVEPEDKLKIVEALQDRGEIVAMTGDGVNDAPALKKADIGVAMGLHGTEVAKEASAMILMDDDFATIVHAVEQGRRIYDNIRKFIKYILSTNSGELWIMFLAPLAGLPIPLTPLQILWINLVTDGLPAIALAMEPEEAATMQRGPRPPSESIFAHGLGIHAVWVGLVMAAAVLWAQWSWLGLGSGHWQTMVFTVLAFSQLGHALAMRSETASFFRLRLFANPWMLGAVGICGLAQLIAVYAPSMNRVFLTSPLSAGELAVCLALSALPFFGAEAEKVWLRSRAAGRAA